MIKKLVVTMLFGLGAFAQSEWIKRLPLTQGSAVWASAAQGQTEPRPKLNWKNSVLSPYLLPETTASGSVNTVFYTILEPRVGGWRATVVNKLIIRIKKIPIEIIKTTTHMGGQALIVSVTLKE